MPAMAPDSGQLYIQAFLLTGRCGSLIVHILDEIDVYILVGVSLSEPHTSGTAFHACVCMHVCLVRPLTIYHREWVLFWYHHSCTQFMQNAISERIHFLQN